MSMKENLLARFASVLADSIALCEAEPETTVLIISTIYLQATLNASTNQQMLHSSK